MNLTSVKIWQCRSFSSIEERLLLIQITTISHALAISKLVEAKSEGIMIVFIYLLDSLKFSFLSFL